MVPGDFRSRLFADGRVPQTCHRLVTFSWAVLSLNAVVAIAIAIAGEPVPTTLVGRSVRFEQIVIDGPELKAKPISKETPLVVRIESVYPHGSAFRYDIEAYALEAGEYDLHDYLTPIHIGDSSSSSELPQSVNPDPTGLTLSVKSSLEEGHVEPHSLRPARSPWLGGYRLSLILGGMLWVLGLVGLLRWGHQKRAEDQVVNVTTPLTTADRLRPLIHDAVNGNLGTDQRAILERLLLAHWRERLALTESDPAEALAILREHPAAGELLRNLEDWLHRPDPPEQINLERLLRPYLEIPVVGAAVEESPR